MDNKIVHTVAHGLRELVKNNEFAQVLDILEHTTEGKFHDIYTEILVQYSSFNDFGREMRLGTSDETRLDRKKNQLRLHLFELIDALEKLGAFSDVALPNRKTITLTIQLDFTNYTPQMGEELLNFLTKTINEGMGNLTLKAAYPGSVNLVIEGDEAAITALMAQFEAANATNPVELPNGMTIKNITTDNEGVLHEKIALCFYNLLLLESPDFEAARGIYEAMEKQKIAPNVDIFTHLIIKIPDYQTALIWFNYMLDKGIASNETLDALMMEKNHAATYADTLQPQAAVDATEQKAAETGVGSLVQDALGYALSAQSAPITQHHDELSAQLTAHIFDNLDKRETHEWPSYIWYSASEWAVQQGKKGPIQADKRLKTSKKTIFEPQRDLVLSEVFIKDDYLMLNAFELTIVRHTLGDADYLMLEAHFREGKSYKTIAEEMDFDASDVARRINLARKICQKLKNAGQN
jgi:hypothetical protein